MRGGGGGAAKDQSGDMDAEQQQQRFLAEWLGVDEDSGLYVLVAGIVLLGLTFLACFYCKVYDPIKLWCIKMHKKHCTKKPKAVAAVPPGTPPTPEVKSLSFFLFFCVAEKNEWYTSL